MFKRKILVLYSITILILLSFTKIINATTLPLTDKIITIDPGHGGRDPGTIYQDIYEKNLNLEISLILASKLREAGATVYLIRNSDIDLSSIYDQKKKRGDLYRRLLKIKENNSDLYISIHINSYKNSAYHGAEVLYNPINKTNKLLAELIMLEFKTNLNSKRDIHTTDLYMYKNTTVPGVLVECGYLSNYQERTLLRTKEYQEKISKSITNGIINYLKTIDSY